MADITALKNRIRAAIKANDNQEITGPVLQQALLDIVDELNGATETEAGARQNGDSTLSGMINAEKTRAEGAENTLQQNITAEKNRAEGAENTLQQNITAEKNRAEGAESVLRGLIDGITENIENGYMYAGIATPSSTPATGKVFYLALTAGTYTNFGNTEVSQGINILKYNGASWVKEQALFTDGGVFDISAYRATGDTLATYADLTAALGTNGENIPQSLRKGGMSVKFVQSSDNKYVQYRLMSDSFGTIESDWQNIGLAQQIGLSETVAMSQKAVTDELNNINASNVTYNHNDSNLDATNVQQAIDEVRKRSNYNDGDNIIDFNTINQVVDGQEYIFAFVDAKKKLLVGIRKEDGLPYYGAGIPPQVREYVDKIKELLVLKADIKDMNSNMAEIIKKSNPNDEYGNVIATNSIVKSLSHNEYISLIVDKKNKPLIGILNSGVLKSFLGLDVQGQIIQKVNDNAEWLVLAIDKNRKPLYGIDRKGEIRLGAGIPKQFSNYVENKISQLSDKISFLQERKTRLNKLRQFFIIDGKAVCNLRMDDDSIIDGVTAKYAEIILDDNIVSCYANVSWTGDGNATMIIHDQNSNDRIGNITNHSWHVCYHRSYVQFGLFTNREWNTERINYTECLADDTTIYKIGFEIKGNDTIDLLLPTGEIIERTINGLDGYIGNHFLFEIYGDYLTSQKNGEDNWDFPRPSFRAVKATPKSGRIFWDSFNREDGILQCSPSGHQYILFSNDSETLK